MSRRLGLSIVILAVLVLALGTWVSVDRARQAGEETKEEEIAKSRRSETPSSNRAASALREMLGEGDSFTETSFEGLQRQVAALSDGELQELLQKVGREEEKGIRGWLRVALHAEWARRDTAAAVALFEKLRKPGVASAWAQQQIFYGVFLGWAEVNPTAALARLRAMEDEPKASQDLDRYWAQSAYRQAFLELGGKGAAAAWKEIPTDKWREFSLQGFFQSFGKIEDALVFADKFAAAMAPAPAEVPQGLNGGFSEFSKVPQDDLIAIHLAGSLVELDREAAQNWVTTNFGEGSMVWSNVLYRWAVSQPRAALEGLQATPHQPGEQQTVLRGIIHGDPALAPDAVASLANPQVGERALRIALMSMGNQNVADYFPGPGQGSRLPDFASNYESLLRAAEGSGMKPDAIAQTRSAIHRTFSAHVPAAMEAYQSGSQ